jgi:beta-phosphoglucomutase-like phosphatase (HAD superfamily)
LLDFDGVLTKKAKVHAAAWKEMFDAYRGNGRRGPASASGWESQGPDAMRTLRRRVC